MRADTPRRLAGKIAAIVAEMNYAQQRMLQLRTTQDRYLLQPDEPPASYGEFLTRTAGPLLHEPSARRRARDAAQRASR
jgi:hypothetical protein